MDIGAILRDEFSRVAAQNRPPFESVFDYAAFQASKDVAIKEWKALVKEEQLKYTRGLRTFYEEKSLLPEENQEFLNAKNLFLLNNEVRARIGAKSMDCTLRLRH